MESNFLDRISKLLKREKIGFRKKILIFSFFLFIAVIIWFLKALEKNYTTEIDYPVRYRNFPEDKTLIGEVPDHLKLQVYAHGYVLFRHKISSRYIPIVISVRSFSLSQLRNGDSSFYFIETRFMKDYIDKQLSSEFDILDVDPDTLIFPFASVISKKLPVKADIAYELDQQLILKNAPLIEPDSVEVTGPDYILDTLSRVHTRNKDLGLISGTVDFNMMLRTIRHTTIDPEEVELTFEVEKFTEKSIAVPVSIVNVPDSLRVVTFPREINVTCQVGLSNYERLQPAMFLAVVDYSDLKGGSSRVKVELERYPEFITSINYTPKNLEYLIERK